MRKVMMMVLVMVVGMLAGCGSEMHYTTVGGVCSRLADAFSLKAIQCGLLPPTQEGQFRSQFVFECCQKECSQPSTQTTTGPVTQDSVDSWVEHCTDDIEHQTCGSTLQIPPACSAGPAH